MDQDLNEIYAKLINSKNGQTEAFICDFCKKNFQTTNFDTLYSHKNSCPGFADFQRSDEKMSDKGSSMMDTDDIKNLEVDAKYSTKQLNKLLTKMFVACNIPFRVTDNVHFKTFMNAVQKAERLYKPPCRQILSTSCILRVHEDITKERRRLLNNTHSVIMVDGWKNKNTNKKFLVFSLKNINTCHTFLTFTDHTLESKDGESLAKAINEAIIFAKEEYNTDVFGIVTDNDSKIVCGARLSNSSDKTQLYQSTCSSHSGNLFLKKLVDASFAETVREIVTAYRDSKVQALLLKEKGSKVQNYPDTRFCYFRDTCQSILNNLDKMQQVASSNDVNINENVYNAIFDDNFETKLLETIELLDPVCKLINACQNPNSNIADAVDMWILLRCSKQYDKALINSRIKKAIWPIGYAAHILHPKYQGAGLSDEEEAIALKFFEENFDRETLSELHHFLNDRETVLQQLMDKCNDPITFWRLSDIFYPHLHKEALKISLMPASTAQLESLFSNWAFIHSAHRNRLVNMKSAVLVDIYYSLRHFKFNADIDCK